MGLPLDGLDRDTVRNGIAKYFDFDGMKLVTDRVHGEDSIYEIASETDPRRTVAEKCIEYARRHGMLANLLVEVANDTKVADGLRKQLAQALRDAFRAYEDIASPVKNLAIVWSQTPPTALGVAAEAERLKRFVVNVADSVERPDVLRAMRDSAIRLDQHSRAVALLLQREDALSAFFLETSQVEVDESAEAARIAGDLLNRLSRPRQDSIEVGWVVGLGKAIEAYRAALAARDFDAIRSARNVLMHLLEATTGRFGEDLRACAATLPFERVAVVLRDAASVSGSATATTTVREAILRCCIALSYRQEMHIRWTDALDSLEDLRELIPIDSSAPDDAWLVTMSDKWPTVRTSIRTLCLLLTVDPALHEREQSLADSVGDAIAAAVQREPSATPDLRAAVESYLGLVEKAATAIADQLEKELDKLGELRKILRAIRTALA